MISEATSIVISLSLVFTLSMPQALADPAPTLDTVDAGGDVFSEEDLSRAKVLMREADRFQKEKKLSLALDAAAAAHRLAPYVGSACTSAVLASNLERNIEAAERYKDCIQRAIAYGLKTSDPPMWEAILADNEIVRSRVSVLRLSADPLLQVSVDERLVGFASEHKELFLEPNTMHTITGDNGMGMRARVSVKMRAGEQRDVFLRAEREPESEESTTKSVVREAVKQQASMPMPMPVERVHAAPDEGRKWIPAALGGGAVVGFVATAISAALVWNTKSIANALTEQIPEQERNECVKVGDPRCVSIAGLKRSADTLTGMSVGFGALTTLLGGAAIVLHVTSPPPPSGAAQTLHKTRMASKPSQSFLGVQWSSSW